MSSGDDIAAALKTFFPSIHYTDIEALIKVCTLILRVKGSMFNLLSQAYPISDFASSASLQFQTITGDSEFRCAVSPDHHLSVCFVQQGLINFLQREIMGEKFGESATSWAYRYNQRNPTSEWTGVGHAAENWMMFRGSNTGYAALCDFFSSSKILIPMIALMDRLLLVQ